MKEYGQAQGTDPGEHLAAARRALSSGDLDGAIAGFRAHLTLAPDDADVLTDLGGLLRSRGELDAAQGYLDRALMLAPGRPGPRINLGLIQLDRGIYDAAAELLRSAIDLDGSIPAAWNNLGIVESRRGQDEAAVQAFERGLQLAPGSHIIAINAAESLRRLGRIDAARAHIERVLAGAPDDPRAVCTRAEILRDQGRIEDAIAGLRSAIAKAPHDPNLRRLLARLLADAGDPAAAAAELDSALAAGIDDPLLKIARAASLEREGAVAAAETMLASVGPLAMRDPEALITAARLRERSGALEAAVRELEALTARGADSLSLDSAALQLSRLRIRQGGAADAMAAADAANTTATRRRAAQRGGGDEPLLAELRDRVDEVARGLAIDDWPALPTPTDGTAAPSFIVGLPRAGATAVARALAMAGGASALLSRRPLAAMISALQGYGDATLIDALREMDIGRRALARKAYWDSASAGASTQLFDAAPWSLAYAHAASRVFPGARFLEVLRHPCEVFLSCQLHADDSISLGAPLRDPDELLLALERAMGAWQRIRSVAAPEVLSVRIEDLRASPDGVATEIAVWAGTGTGADDLAAALTPSALDAAMPDPLLVRGPEAWQPFRERLSPWMDRLAALAVAAGYPDPR